MTVTINGTTGIDTPSLTADTTTLVVDETNNRVGIGTATPLNELHVNGSIRISQDGGVIGNGDEKIKFDETGQTIQFQTADTERMRIQSNGAVSIGIDASDFEFRAFDSNGDATTGAGLAMFGNSTSSLSAVKTATGYSFVPRIMVAGGGESNAGIGFLNFDGTDTYCQIGVAGSELRFNGKSGDGQAMNLNMLNGNLTVQGALSKGSGSFKITHPLESKAETHHLVHSFVEAPQADNIYRGKVDLVAGSATVNIDTVAGMTEGTFVALNREVQCFTSNESGWTAVKGSVSGNTLTITAQDNTCTDTISWLVIGERQDPHMYDTTWTDENGKVIVEPEIPTEDPEEESE